LIGQSGTGKLLWWLLLAAISVTLLLPFAVADVPPMQDYPNHLARLFVLSFRGTDPVLARFYQPHWAIIPNLALDLIVPPLIRVFPVHDVGRVVAGCVVLLPLFGAVAYHRALTGRLSWWPLASALFAFNGASLRGFLNFIASLGLALLLAAVWSAWREHAPRRTLVVAALGAVGLFLCHLMGLVFFAILIGARDAAWLRARHPRMRAILARALFSGVVFVLPLALYALSDLREMAGDAVFRTAAGKAEAALMPVINYNWPLDAATGLAVIGVVALCLARRWVTMRFEALVALGTLMLLFLGTPTAFKGTFDLDTRFIVMAAFLLPAALEAGAIPRRAANLLTGGFATLFVVRMALILMIWHGWANDLARFRAVIAPVRLGDVVLTAGDPPGPRLSDGAIAGTHLPALLVIEHRAWWPFLFDNPSQQPIETREPFRTLAALTDAAADPVGLVARGGDPALAPVTHVLVLGPPPNPVPDGLVRISGNEVAALFAVRSARSRPLVH